MDNPIIIRIPRRAATVALALLVLTSVVTFAGWADRGPARPKRAPTAIWRRW